MPSPAAKARTRTSAPGSEAPPAGGFTLVELLVVVVLIALASGIAGLALNQGESARLEREGARLAALLEAARAEARANGTAVRFELATDPDAGGQAFRFVGLPPGEGPSATRWLEPDTTARIDGATALTLGPEPLIGRQRVVLSLGGRALGLATDGLSPFQPQAVEDPR